MQLVGNKWDLVLESEYHKDYFKKVVEFINKEYKIKTIYPLKSKILRSLVLTDYDEVKVVILGQDPYHGEGEANGLCFAVSNGIKLPPSLQNIYKELEADLGIPRSSVGNLECWAKEGVLLLNSVLTVEKDKAASHKGIGWENFTDAIIKKINEKETPVVFILWGNNAKAKEKLPALEIEPYATENVDFDTFCKSDFRAVKVKDCQPVKKSDKLLCFTLDDGTGTDRQILSGIAKFYKPEELIGKTLVAITNLPPRKMMGKPSCGMLLSAVHTEKGEEKLNLIMIDDKIPAGAKLC